MRQCQPDIWGCWAGLEQGAFFSFPLVGRDERSSLLGWHIESSRVGDHGDVFQMAPSGDAAFEVTTEALHPRATPKESLGRGEVPGRFRLDSELGYFVPQRRVEFHRRVDNITSILFTHSSEKLRLVGGTKTKKSL